MSDDRIDLNLLYGSPTPSVEPCPFCGEQIIFRERFGLIQFRCDIFSKCTGSFLSTFCPPDEFKNALDRWNQRPLQIRARHTAIQEAAEIARKCNARRVDAAYAITSRILELIRR